MYEWIAETFGVGDGIARAMSFIIALAIVFGLIGLVLFVLRQLTGNRISTGRNRQPRIAVMDAMHIDQRRRLLLVRRDNVEHLILVGGPTDVVVEQAIVRGNPVSASYPRGGQPAPQFGSPPFEGEPEPYAAQPNWPTAPAPVAAASAPAQQSPQMVAAPVAAAPAAAQYQPASQQMAEITSHPAADLGSAPGQDRTQAAAPVQQRPSSLRQTAQEAALAALRSRNNSPRIEPAQAAREVDESDNVKSLRPRIAALTEPLRRSTPQPVQSPVQAPVSAPAQTAVRPATDAAASVEAPRAAAIAGEAIAAAASNLTSKAGASVAAAGAAVADLARSLSKSSERTVAPAEPEVRRQLTPPSSGPAARARTAFPNGMPPAQQAAPAVAIDPAPVAAVETAAQAEVQAPVVATAAPAARAPDVSPAPVASAAPAVAAPAASAPASVKTFGGFPAQPRPQAASAKPEAAASQAPAAAPVMAEVSLNLSAPAAPLARPAAGLSTDVRLTPLVATQPVAAEPATAADEADPQSAAGDDIFEMDVRPEPKQASAETVASAATLAALTVGEEIEVAAPAEAPASKLSQVIPEIRLTAADLQDPVADAPEVVIPAVEAPVATRDEAGVNAIEEEMARLLSEIGVQGRK
jgi:flagellar protein FliO/FliZ